MPSNLTPQQRESLIGKLLETQAGKVKLAASMTLPLRDRLDYMSVGRKAFIYDPLPQGALPYYDKDIDVPAIVIGEEGQTPEAVIRGTRILVPLFELGSNPKVSFTELKERRYNLIDRAQDKARQDLQEKEDSLIFAAMADACAINNNTQVAAAKLDRDDLADAFAQVERVGLRIAYIFCNALDYSDIRKFGRDQLDINTQASLLATGIMANIWGATIITTRAVPVGTVYVVAEPEFVGVMPVRIELTVLPADDPENRMIGWSIFENIGIGIHNSNGITDIKITRV